MKRTRIRPISKRDDRTLEMKADRLWSARILAENHGRCWKCNRKPATDPHHVIGRANKRLRHDRNNGIGLCRFHHDWAHAKPEEFRVWIREARPAMYEYLKMMRYVLLTTPYHVWLEERIEELSA